MWISLSSSLLSEVWVVRIRHHTAKTEVASYIFMATTLHQMTLLLHQPMTFPTRNTKLEWKIPNNPNQSKLNQHKAHFTTRAIVAEHRVVLFNRKSMGLHSLCIAAISTNRFCLLFGCSRKIKLFLLFLFKRIKF